MSVSKNLKARVLSRFDELIVEGKALADSIKVFEPNQYSVPYKTTYSWEPQRFARWKTSCLTLFDPLAKQGTKLKEQIDLFGSATGEKPHVEYCLGILESVRENFANGFLDNLLSLIEAEMAADYLGQAEELLGEGGSGQYDHVPAAVLAGAVLEKALRKMCDLQQPPIPTTKKDGKPKTIDPLIDDLKKVGFFNDVKAKQLRGWAAIRNKAAHGEFDQFTKADVKGMVEGITNFLADYLR